MSSVATPEESRSPVPSVDSTVVSSCAHNENYRGIYVSDLAQDVSEDELLNFFSESFPTTSSVKIITDYRTGRSKGCGYVYFSSMADRDRALTEMNGVLLRSRVMRVNEITPPRSDQLCKRVSSSTTSSSKGSHGGHAWEPSSPSELHPADIDPTNTTLFIGGLSSCVTESQLKDIFVKYGQIIYTKVPKGKGCGFVQYVDRWSAQMAMTHMNRVVIGNSALRISWGRSSSKLAAEVAAAHQNGGPVPPSPLPAGLPHQAMPVMPTWRYPAYISPGGGMPWAYTTAPTHNAHPYAHYPYTYYMCADASGVPAMVGNAPHGYVLGPKQRQQSQGQVALVAAPYPAALTWQQPATVLQTRG